MERIFNLESYQIVAYVIKETTFGVFINYHNRPQSRFGANASISRINSLISFDIMIACYTKIRNIS